MFAAANQPLTATPPFKQSENEATLIQQHGNKVQPRRGPTRSTSLYLRDKAIYSGSRTRRPRRHRYSPRSSHSTQRTQSKISPPQPGVEIAMVCMGSHVFVA